jgi:hypothetical protein
LKGIGEIVPVAVDPLIKEITFSDKPGGASRYWITAVDAIGQEGQPSSPAWYNYFGYKGYYEGDWHQ